MQDLKRSRPLAKGEIDLRVGNGARVAALAVGTYYLSLPSGIILELDNCYYVPAISRNIISVSCLDKKGFSFIIKNKCCSIYFGDMHNCLMDCMSLILIILSILLIPKGLNLMI